MFNYRTMQQAVLSAIILLNAHASDAFTTQSFRDNAELSIALSQSNFNRLVVKGDKITKAHFPEGAMSVENDEDGSLYVSLAARAPFTLFLTTEAGHHFSATVSAEEALGKTVEFVPLQVAQHSSTPSSNVQSTQTDIPKANTITSLMTSMMNGQVPKGYEQKKHYGQVKRLSQGLMLTPRATFNGMEFKGEVFTLYNGGRLPLDLQESWFSDNGVKAVSLSATTLAPKQSAELYRISEVRHG